METGTAYAVPVFRSLPGGSRSSSAVGRGLVREAHQIIYADIVKDRQHAGGPGCQHLSAPLIPGVCGLRDVEQLRQGSLGQIPLLPQFPQTMIYRRRLLSGFSLFYGTQGLGTGFYTIIA